MTQSIFNSEKLQRRLADINKSGKRTSARLRALVTVLAEWADAETPRDSRFPVPIAAEDLDALRSVICQQLSRGRYANIPVLTDQILFILLGALKARRHNSAAKTWELTMLSIDSLLSNAYQPLIPQTMHNAYAVLLSLLLLCGGYGYITYTRQPAVSAAPENFAKPIFAQSPYIPTHVHSFRKIMLHANCEYPQAAMLPIEQRVAFLDFLRNGQFALADVKNLETALSKVDCFYASTINNSTIN